ncbi:hypothetical protein [Trichlorobacter sp.]|uniref:hypothetical protein n=1 Tax=Trichlorobacter sp. TaxID=2911007 RepID=UPI002A372141|nr:hypothetical protein [Trichlorobacter sp.]MDY0385085.1 hypothetical protein [Trichlorobacter sp.]
MQNIIFKINALRHWLSEMKFTWLSLTIILIALIISLGPYSTEPVIRITGLFLQVLGIGTVIWGISETRALFGHPSFANKTKEWLKRFPLFQRKHVSIACSGSISIALTGNGRAYSTHSAGNNPTVENRLEALEKNIASIHERINQTQKDIDQECQKSATALQQETQLRQTEDRIIQEKLEATGTGGVHISAIGASWLFVGVVLSTASVEIAKLLKYLFNT